MKSQKRLSAYEIFREMEYDTPEFHQLADEIAQYLKRKRIKDIVDLQKKCKEAELNWFSYHYALGRHSYAASLCHDIAQYGRMVLSPERQEFTAYDIASFFDPKMHKQCITRYEGKEQPVDYFDSWIPIYDGSGGYKFEKVKRPIDRYAAAPYRCCYINEEYIVEDNDATS